MHLPSPGVPCWLLLASLAVLPACARVPVSEPPAAPVVAASDGEAPSSPARFHPGAHLDPAARAALDEVLGDEFCPCGCPHTLAACLASHDCPHARRAASLAARLVGTGRPASEAVLVLARYYEGFRLPRAALTPDPRQCQGAVDAAVTLVSFSDFECPYCAAARPLLEAFARANASRLRYCALAFPLPSHPNAAAAGQAVLEARDQGRFWEMHDQLFLHQDDLGPAALPGLAREAGVDPVKLKAALADGRHLEELHAQREQGRAAGVASTPTLFFNGRRFSLPFSEENLLLALEEELEWQAHGQAWARD